ncbi:MAG: rod shape-determining protein MreC [Nitrospinota bacterium]
MLGLFHRHRQGLLLTLFLMCSLTLMTLGARRRRSLTLLDRAALATVGPLQSLVSSPIGWGRSIFEEYVSLWRVQQENERLRAELARLRARVNAMGEARLRAERLQALLAFKESQSLPALAARVVGWDATNWGKTVVVNRGGADGARPGMPVVAHAGVVGRIIKASDHYAQVLLLTDYRSAVDVLVQRSRASGVFVMRGAQRGALKYVSRDAELRVGDALISSGLGGVFPKGLMVGRITDISPDGDGLFRSVEAAPAVDFRRLEEVLILLKRPG